MPLIIAPLSEFQREAADLSESEFLNQYDSPFLIIQDLEEGSSLDFTIEIQTADTDKVKSGIDVAHELSGETEKLLVTLKKEVLVAGPPLITVGRLPQNDIVLKHRMISKIHAVFEPLGDDWILHDLGSVNGTKVNDQQISKYRGFPLKGGEIIRFAEFCNSVFHTPQSFYWSFCS